jgi:hypothetical protein
MYRSTALLVVVLATAAARAGDDGPAAGPFKSAAGRFEVTFPGRPTERTTTSQTALGEVEIKLTLADLKDRVYMVGYYDFPAGSVTDKNRKKVLKAAQDGSVKKVQGKVLSEREVTVGEKKLDGRESVVEHGNRKGVYSRSRILFDGDRHYILTVLGTVEGVKGDAATKFLDSFKVTK